MHRKRVDRDINVHLADEAAETIRAIRDGAVDAFVVEEEEGRRVYTLQGSDVPYSVLVECMHQCAGMLDADCDLRKSDRYSVTCGAMLIRHGNNSERSQEVVEVCPPLHLGAGIPATHQ